MKFKEFLNESPVDLDTTSKNDIKDNVPTYNEIMKTLRNKVGFIREYDMISNGYEYALVDKENKKVMAYSRISKSHIPRSALKEIKKQSLLWKDNDITSSEIRYMFFQALDDHETIFSDYYQTKGGRSFWKSLYNEYKGSRYYEIGYFDEAEDRLVPFVKSDGDDEFNAHYGRNNYTKLYIKSK